MIDEAASLFSVGVFLLYFRRMVTLRFLQHGWTFVTQNFLHGALCICSIYDLMTYGLSTLPVVASLAAAVYIERSKENFVKVTGEWTRP